MKLSQRERLYKRMTVWADARAQGRAPSTIEHAEDEVFEVVEEIEKDAGDGFSQLEQALDFLKDDFGEFLLIARLASKDRHIVLAVAEDDAGYERLALLVRKYAAGELAEDEIDLDAVEAAIGDKESTS